MSDSVPDWVKRSMSRPKRSWNSSATSVAVGDGVTKSVPTWSSAWRTWSTTTGLRWPTIIAPKPIDMSSSVRPSTSVTWAPRAETIEMG